MTYILNIIDKIYGSEYFTTVLIASMGVLIFMFVLVLIIGKIDAKKEEIKKNKLLEEKDITFEEIKEEDKLKEDVTFEEATITKNLEDFKLSIEKEINKDTKINLSLEKSQRPYKVIEMKEIENTVVLPKITGEELEHTLILPKIDIEEASEKQDVDLPKLNDKEEKNDYLKQNIFSSANES